MNGLTVCLVLLLSMMPGILSYCSLSTIPPENSRMTQNILNDGTMQFIYQCRKGYRIKGHKVRTCINLQDWDYPAPECVPRSSSPRRRPDLYLGDEPVEEPIALPGVEFLGVKEYLRMSNNTDELKKPRNAQKDGKKKKRKRKKSKSLSKPSTAKKLNETVVSQLDNSCFVKTRRKRLIKAPLIEHAYLAKYARRKNVLPPYNRYLVAVYECADGYVFVESTTDRLFCSNGTWLGRRPKCIKENQPPIDKVKRCDQGAGECEHVCEDTPTGIKCSCFDGFRAEGSSCIDIDECAENKTQCAHICHNELGSYSCECHHGFQLGTDRHSCQDIDECLSNNGHGPCQGSCRNFVGGYECSCTNIPGYKLAADNHTCEDVDECAVNNANCSHLCLNTPGSVFCLCPDGFYLTDDWKTCQDINECKTTEKICTEDTECENTMGSYKCISRIVHPNMATKFLREEDYDSEREDDNEKDDDDDEDEDDYEEEITEVPENPRKCEDGFERNENFECVDINECENNSHGCQHECINEPGRYRCTCHDGYVLAEDRATCEDVDECANRSSPCSHICRNTIGTYTCECPPGFILTDDNATCAERKYCMHLNLCSHICEYTKDGPRCVCPLGFYLSDDRVTCLDVNECLEFTVCSYECVNTPGSYRCACPPDMRLAEDAASCEVSTCPPGLKRDDDDSECRDIDECLDGEYECSHLCVNTYGSYRCSCPSGWILENDNFTCAKIDPCSDSPCSHSCVATGSKYRCECPAGYFVNVYGKCEDKDECQSEMTNDCSHDCKNLEGSYLCSCPIGFELGEDNRTCVIQNECTDPQENNNCTCSAGYSYSYKEQICVDIDECQDERENKCSHDCINTDGSYSCQCPSGWRLQEDSRTCLQLSTDDPCVQDHGCSHTCEQNDGRIRCGCPEGYELQDDEKTCRDVDECTDGSHACSHVCVNTEGDYFCECPSGYQLRDDDRNCQDIDECSIEDTGCSHGCSNTNGTFDCTCPEGYELQDDGRTCEDINECIRNNGECSHLCANTEGSFECACPDNYKLLKDDGRTCVEINACSIDNGGCSHFCRQDENGQAFCSCPFEMTLSEDGATCAYENECLNENNGGCSHLCYQEDGNVTCACPSGMILAEDGQLCVVNGCKIDNGGCSHLCHDDEDSNVTCLCPPGMSLSQDDDTLCVENNRCLIDNGGCSDICVWVNDSIVCECPDGYHLSSQDNTTCVDIDECLELRDNCTHRCLNIPGDFDCACNAGFTQNSQDPTLCDDINECESETAKCSHLCVNLVGSFRCLCPAEYILERDNRTCVPVDGCKHNNGNCSHFCNRENETSDGVSSVVCSCPLGYRLKREDPKTCEDINECEDFENDVESGCSHKCVNTEGGYRCECPTGYVLTPEDRKNCVEVDECLTDDHNCTHECVNLPGGYTCACHAGYYLHTDGSNCFDIDECQERNGECSHVCTNTAGGHLCSCPSGYELSQDERSCMDVDECANDNGICDERATCVNTVGSFLCECLPDHVRRNGTCRPSDPCQDQLNGGCEQICVAVNGTAVCSCEKGFQKSGIDASECHDIDECAEGQHNCEHICVNKPGSYECGCKEGFRMVNSTCVDINECLERAPCNEKCINTPGSYYCTCPLGFQLQKNECVDINECEWNRDRCDHECINTVGSFVCACRTGYTLITRGQCQDVNECLNRNGGCTGECVNTAGSYYCSCSVDLVLAPDERTCVSPTSRCHAMEPPLHGEIRCPGHSSGASVYPQGAKCHVRCRRGFRLEGAHTRHCVSDGRWSGKEPICLREVVTDSLYNPNTPRPFVSCPQDMDVELPARQNTIRVTFPQPKSNMNWWRYVHASPPWAKQLQADLPAGTTVVTFTAWSPVSNYTSTCRIVIRVRDTENPKVTMCPTSFEVRLSPGERNRLIFWQEPTFTDNVAVEHVYKTKGPGHVMYPGVHSVRYVASDAAGNRAECHFSIHVRESEEDHNHSSEPRFYRRKMLMCPGRPPQSVPSSSYNWQIPSGCYLRYTRIFSGAYQRHPERRQNGYQDAGASYRELPPIQQIQTREDVAAPYNNDDYRHSGRQHEPWQAQEQRRRQQQQQLLHRQYRQRATRTDHVVSPPTHYGGAGRVETRILPPRHECCT
ncbi:fibrillin-1-like isoform X1 [Nylanderia fulva]|uniref:fibrillin-1-like isoform X1 n=2 Tax=Nylanderia fulva TaxID=613905 RepID=UPI0010FB2635|nr:fibrillin-1-like isoform X1 [Nylanderia fulva]XP_029163193.1 fibrillin-1-like isoform X1 [Nylanderia fulva]